MNTVRYSVPVVGADHKNLPQVLIKQGVDSEEKKIQVLKTETAGQLRLSEERGAKRKEKNEALEKNKREKTTKQL